MIPSYDVFVVQYGVVPEPVRPIPAYIGEPDPQHVVGRREPVALIWRHLANGTSVLVTGGRRKGKSWTVKALASTVSDGWVAVYVDVEALTSVEGLVGLLADRLRDALPARAQLIDTLLSADFEVTAARGRVTHAPQDPAERLRRLVRGSTESGRRLVIVLDELPIMARTLAEADPEKALHLLRTLRALRHQQPGVVFVCAGSIGFHHVRQDEVEVGAAINDLYGVPVGPLTRDYAVHLARCLLLGIGIETTPDDGVAAAIADATEGVPFYAHKLVAALDERRRAGLPVDQAAVWSTRDAAISLQAGDPWELGHFESRVRKYFGPDLNLALGLLDALAREPSARLAFDVLLERVRIDPEVARTMPAVERTRALSVVRRLGADDYIVAATDGVISFTSGVLRDAWQAMRFLT